MMSYHCWLFGVVMRRARFAARALVLLAVADSLPEGRCSAATLTWSGAAPNIGVLNNSNWSNLFNWQGALVPANDGTAAVVMPVTPRDNANVYAAWSIATLTFQGPGDYSLNNSTLTVNDITHSGSGTVTF